MRGFYFGFSLCILQTIYYDYKRNLKQKKFDNKMIEYLKNKEKNI
jgi:cell division protein FtsB